MVECCELLDARNTLPDPTKHYDLLMVQQGGNATFRKIQRYGRVSSKTAARIGRSAIERRGAMQRLAVNVGPRGLRHAFLVIHA